MRKLYKYSHSVSAGGQHFIQKAKSQSTVFDGVVAERLRHALVNSARDLQAEDVTAKVCTNHFHVFFHLPRKYAPVLFIEAFRLTAESIMKDFEINDKLDDKYVFTGIYDLSEDCIRKELKSIGEDL